MTKDEFIAAWCAEKRFTLAQFHDFYVALPCACDHEGCEGWGAVPNKPDCIEDHMRLYAPDGWTQSSEGWDITEGAKLTSEDVAGVKQGDADGSR